MRSDAGIDYGDLEISFRPMTFTFNDEGRATVDAEHAISATVYRVRPESRGELVLASADPRCPPAFHHNYLAAEGDLRAMIVGLRKVRDILATEPLASNITGELAPGAAFRSDADLADYIQSNAKCAYHQAGSCKMGTDDMAVVDKRLRVHGVDRLRVMDASIMPTVTSGNTNAPTIMIGEKGADMVLTDARA